MRTGVGFLIVLVFLFLPLCANATVVKDFYCNGTIVDGEIFNTVNIWNTANVSMSGGEVGILNSYNLSHINISGGSIADIQLNDAVVASISGGEITGTLGMFTASTIHVYGKNLNFTSDGGATGWLTGNWADNTPFLIYCRSSSYPTSHLILHTIPEPTTLSILLFGFFTIKKFRG